MTPMLLPADEIRCDGLINGEPCALKSRCRRWLTWSEEHWEFYAGPDAYSVGTDLCRPGDHSMLLPVTPC